MRLRAVLGHMHISLPPTSNMVIRVLIVPQRLGGNDLLVVALCRRQAGGADVCDAAATGAVGAVAVVAGWALAHDFAVNVTGWGC